MSQCVSIWGRFADQDTAGQALNLLETGGFAQSQIAIEKRFQDALAGLQWDHAIYVRLPEGIVTGFAGGGVLAALVCCILARGIPPALPTAVVTAFGVVAGTIVGAFAGMLLALYESRQLRQLKQDTISIGVLCFDQIAEHRAKVALREAGAGTIDTLP